jgi:hypothetical protein
MPKDYDIGYGKPPEENRFKQGKSGNPQGRPKGSKNTYKLLNDILNQKIVVSEGDEKIKISKKVAMLTQLVNKGVKGDIKAISALLPHLLIADLKEEERHQIRELLNQDDQLIIADYLSRYHGTAEDEAHE